MYLSPGTYSDIFYLYDFVCVRVVRAHLWRSNFDILHR